MIFRKTQDYIDSKGNTKTIKGIAFFILSFPWHIQEYS